MGDLRLASSVCMWKCACMHACMCFVYADHVFVCWDALAACKTANHIFLHLPLQKYKRKRTPNGSTHA